MLLLYCPCPDLETAQRLAQDLVTHQLVACANILPGVTSVYTWEGSIRQETETLLLAKTTEACQADVQAYLEKSHPYTCPAILFLPVESSNAVFENWVNSSIGKVKY